MSVSYSSALHLATLQSLHSDVGVLLFCSAFGNASESPLRSTLIYFSTGLQNLTTLSNPTAVILHKGNSVTIHCTHNLPNDIEIFTVTIKGTKVLCFSQFNRQEWLVSKTCKESIQINWNNETREIFFSLMKLQINDSGLYSCEVKRAAPPPAQVFSKNITICVTAPPAVSVSDVKEPSSGLPMLLCSSQGFYPKTIEQVWFRDGQLLNTRLSDRQREDNTDGSITVHSYLPLSSGPSKAGLYLCWVNHSSLSHPITVNHTVMSNGFPVSWLFIVVSIGAVLILVVLIVMIFKCTHFKRVKHLFPLGTSQEPVHTVSSVTENIIYSTLGDHHPITLSTAIPT
ncbi:tapasin-related protein-like isoform 1-T1 [Salvelinus alpinus]